VHRDTLKVVVITSLGVASLAYWIKSSLAGGGHARHAQREKINFVLCHRLRPQVVVADASLRAFSLEF